MAPEKFYLLLGEADRESVTANLKISGTKYKKKRLDSSLANWETIFPLVDDTENIGIIAKISNQTIAVMFSDVYAKATERLLQSAGRKKHVFFVHDSFYKSETDWLDEAQPDDITDWYKTFGSVSNDARNAAIAAFDRNGIDIRSYSSLAAFSIEAVEFIDDIRSNLIFRMYVSDKRMWSGEIRKIISLFQDYLSKVCGTPVKQQEFSTPSGSVFELSTEDDVFLSSVPARFNEFTEFMDASADDVQRATQMLVDRKMSKSDAEIIVLRFAKEARRLHVDLRHERERKVLDVRHRLESELTDVVKNESEWDDINNLIEETMPGIYSISGVMGSIGIAPPKPVTNVLINPQFIQTVNGVVSQAITGNQNFGLGGDQVAKLIEQFGGARSSALISDLQELEDSGSKLERRTSAKSRILAFLSKLGDKVADGAIATAQAYVQAKLGLSG